MAFADRTKRVEMQASGVQERVRYRKALKNLVLFDSLVSASFLQTRAAEIASDSGLVASASRRSEGFGPRRPE